MKNDLKSILLSEEQISNRVREMGAEISRDFADRDPIFVCILKGAVMFFADLCKEITIPMTMDFMAVSSYGASTRSSGEVEIRKDLSISVDRRHVIIVEDIVDSGNTLSYLKRVLENRGAASVSICTLLDKPERRNPAVNIKTDYFGFIIPNEFAVGYGLDYAEKYRNLPYIGVLKPEIYENN